MSTHVQPTPRGRLVDALESTRTVNLAAAFSLALGLFFIFVWSPLPFGWLGIDHYDDRALLLAAGRPFDTTDVPWGYAYYLAFFYVVFGHHPWFPLVAQAVLNASVPLLLFHLVRPLADRRTAVISALIAGVFSFNTVYASTQSSDAVCTVLALASLLLFERGRRRPGLALFIGSGFLAGMAPQFRPNLILLPPLLAAFHVGVGGIDARKLQQAGAYLFTVALLLAPWTIRNYRLTGEMLPTSSHGGYQLWLGTLEMGEYLERREDNPRKVFDSPAFDYTSLENRPIEIGAIAGDCDPEPTLVYWTDLAPTPERVPPRTLGGGRLAYDVPGQRSPTALYYYFESAWTTGSENSRALTPARGGDDPLVFFISTDHLGDLDRHHDLADIFDVIRLLRHQAWNEPLSDGGLWDVTGDGRIDRRDSAMAIEQLMKSVSPGPPADFVREIQSDAEAIVVRLADGSTLRVPHLFDGRVTDLEARGDLASKLVYARQPMVSLLNAAPAADPCGRVHDITVNHAFYRSEPHWMRRYTALAVDNITREPGAFALASLYRMGRLFVIRGSSDVSHTQQFTSSRLIYFAGTAASATVFIAFLGGVWIAWSRRLALLWLLVPIVYVPLTICFVLTNMRYSITVQPLIFAFIAVLASALLDRLSPSARTREARPENAR